MKTEEIDFPEFVKKFNSIVDRGLSSGLGKRDGQMCIEAAVCTALDLPHGDEPWCVAPSVRAFKIALNDSEWSSPKARAEGLRKLGIAQVGSKGVVDDTRFVARLAELIIKVLIPKILREAIPNNQNVEEAAVRCEKEGTSAASTARCAALAVSAARDAASNAVSAARYAASYAAIAASAASEASYATLAARYAARAASYAVIAASTASYAASEACDAAHDKYLKLAADLALQVLTELKSPGVKYI